MNKSSYTKLFLTLAVGLNLLGGCQFLPKSQPQNNTSTTEQANPVKPPQQPNQEQLKKTVEEIDGAFEKYIESQNKFIESFQQESFNQETMRESVNTKDISKKLSQLNQAITELKNEIQPLQTTEFNAISAIISDIEKPIQDLSQQVISPLQDGLTDVAVGEVQVGLKILTKEATNGKGIFGEKTSLGVKNFFSDKSQNISEKIGQLKQAINPTSATTSQPSTSQGASSSDFQRLEQEFNSFKLEANERAKQQDSRIFFWICSQFTLPLFIFLLIRVLRLNKKSEINHPITSKASSQKLEDQVSSGYQKLEAKYNNLENQFEELKRLFENLSRQYSLITPIHSREHKGISDLYDPEKTSGHSSQPLTRSFQRHHQNQPQPALTNTSLSLTESQLIQEYNSNSDALRKKVIGVNVRADSLHQDRMGSNQQIVLEQKNNGNYWVWDSGGVCYLIPKYRLSINKYNFETIQYLFNCEGYPSNSQGFKLLKPAQVYSSDGGKKWQVSQLGILQFY